MLEAEGPNAATSIVMKLAPSNRNARKSDPVMNTYPSPAATPGPLFITGST